MNNLSKYIDHTLLKADASQEEIIKLCQEAKQYDFYSVCINPDFVEIAAKELENSSVKVCTVIGFPLGSSTTSTKAFEAKDAIEKGATEIDMVINISNLKDKKDDEVLTDIIAVVESAKGKALVKVIIEACLLSDEEKQRACLLSKEANADFVKTSTGFSTGGATKEDIALMRKVVGENIGVKASGGVRTYEDAITMIENGATRIGASASIAIVTNSKAQTSGY